MNDFSGKLNLRLPLDLHARLTEIAGALDISLNTLMVTLLAEGATKRANVGKGAPREIAEALAEAVLDSATVPTRNRQLIKRLDETQPQWRMWIPPHRLGAVEE